MKKIDHFQNAINFCRVVNSHNGNVQAIVEELGIKESSVRSRHSRYIEKAKEAGINLAIAPLTQKEPYVKSIDYAKLAKMLS